MSNQKEFPLAPIRGYDIRRPRVHDGVVVFSVGDPIRKESVKDIHIQIDTGADISFLSPEVLEKAGLQPEECLSHGDVGELTTLVVSVSSKKLGLKAFRVHALKWNPSIDKSEKGDPVVFLGLREMEKGFRTIAVDWDQQKVTVRRK